MARKSIRVTKAVQFELHGEINLFEVRSGVDVTTMQRHADLCMHLAEKVSSQAVMEEDGDLELT